MLLYRKLRRMDASALSGTDWDATFEMVQMGVRSGVTKQSPAIL